MKTKRRWLLSVLEEAKKSDAQMPWSRDVRNKNWNARCAERATDKIAASS